MPATGEKGLREEIHAALNEKWELESENKNPRSFEVLGTGQNETLIKWCGEFFSVTAKKIC